MADLDYNHTSEIILAAIPFVDSKLKGPAELIAKALGLLGSFKSLDKSNGILSATFFGIRDSKIDIEGLLKGIRPICNQKEQEIVDRILNIFNMKRMFEVYSTMMSTMKTMQEFGGFNFGDNNSNDSDNVTNNFTGSNFESIFQTFSNAFASGNTPSSSDAPDYSSDYNPFEAADKQNRENRSKEDSNERSDIMDESNNYYKKTEFNNAFNNDSINSYNNDSNSAYNNAFNQNPMNSDYRAENNQTKMNSDVKTENNQNPMNNKMFDMLKAMVPPEQMSTFENLSMLLNTMSYDNNSNQDENKEHNND